MVKAGGKVVLKKIGALGVAVLLCLGLFAGFATQAFAKLGVTVEEAVLKMDDGALASTVEKGSRYNMNLILSVTEAPVNTATIGVKLPGGSFYSTGSGTDFWDAKDIPYTSGTKKVDPFSIPCLYSGSGQTFKATMYFFDGSGNQIKDEKDKVITASFSTTVKQAPKPPAPTPGPEPTPDPEPDSSESSSSESIIKGTGFVLKSINFGGGSVDAGNNFNLDATLLSTNGSYSVENVSVEVTPPKEFSIAAGSSVIYVGTVKPNQNIPITVAMQASAIAEEGSYAVVLAVSGVNAKDGTPANAEMTVTIPITQPDRFEMTNVQVPDFLMANMDDGSGFSNITLVNKGKNIIYNVSVSVEGEGLTTDMGTIFVGNINPGSENGADFNILASMPGTVDAMVLVTYENAKGEENSLTHNFTIDVQDGGGDMGEWGEGEFPEPMPEENVGGGPPWWLWVILACAVAVGITVFVVVRKNNKAKKEAALLDEDDDDGEDA